MTCLTLSTDCSLVSTEKRVPEVAALDDEQILGRQIGVFELARGHRRSSSCLSGFKANVTDEPPVKSMSRSDQPRPYTAAMPIPITISEAPIAGQRTPRKS